MIFSRTEIVSSFSEVKIVLFLKAGTSKIFFSMSYPVNGTHWLPTNASQRSSMVFRNQEAKRYAQ